MDITFLSLPYVYPLCPLNFNHARMFVVADVFARWLSMKKGNKNALLIFPVASHFTGNTAQSTSDLLKNYFSGQKNDKNVRTYDLYRNFYSTPASVIQNFTNPDYLMSYYHHEILWELNNLGVSCDYESAYTTNVDAFGCFVRAVIKCYDREGLLVINSNGDLALNYDDDRWRDDTDSLIRTTDIQKEFQRKAVLSAFGNLSSGWELLRSTGYGVEYENGLIIDPMFDSELFMIFDLYAYWSRKLSIYINNYDLFFERLFLSLKQGKNSFTADNEGQLLAQRILDSLPCDIFFGEEHLKNWLSKKFFAEQRLLHPSFRTRSYRILGMGLWDGKRMSASAGHAILTRDLIRTYGGQIARLIILLSGGNISKGYDFDQSLLKDAQRIINTFSDYWILLRSCPTNGRDQIDINFCAKEIDRLISDGQISRATYKMLVDIPAHCRHPSQECASELLSFYDKYLNIFLPRFLLCQMQ